MPTYTKVKLSGSTQGRGVVIAATSSGGGLTAVHATTTSATSQDEVHLWAVNSDTSDHKLTIEFGGTTAPNDLIEVTIPAESGLVEVVPGLILMGDGSATLTITAFAASASKIILHGFVNRITY